MTTSVAALGECCIVSIGEERHPSVGYPDVRNTQLGHIDKNVLIRLHGREDYMTRTSCSVVPLPVWVHIDVNRGGGGYCYVPESHAVMGLMYKRARQQYRDDSFLRIGMDDCIQRIGRRFHGAWFKLQKPLVSILLDKLEEKLDTVLSPGYGCWFCHYWWGPLWTIAEEQWG